MLCDITTTTSQKNPEKARMLEKPELDTQRASHNSTTSTCRAEDGQALTSCSAQRPVRNAASSRHNVAAADARATSLFSCLTRTSASDPRAASSADPTCSDTNFPFIRPSKALAVTRTATYAKRTGRWISPSSVTGSARGTPADSAHLHHLSAPPRAANRSAFVRFEAAAVTRGWRVRISSSEPTLSNESRLGSTQFHSISRRTRLP
ncbi:hypothetical protein SRHO_G00276120 [Serrasalmus rhombeus]